MKTIKINRLKFEIPTNHKIVGIVSESKLVLRFSFVDSENLFVVKNSPASKNKSGGSS